MRTFQTLVAMALLAATFVPASAQFAHRYPPTMMLERGARLRVVCPTLGSGRVEATYMDHRGDEVVLHVRHLGREVVSVPVKSIEDLELSAGPKTKIGRNMGLGLLIGASIGAGLGFVGGDDTQGFVPFSARGKALMGATVGGSLGLLVGLFKGATTQEETWRTIHVESLTLGMLPDRNPGLVLALDF